MAYYVRKGKHTHPFCVITDATYGLFHHGQGDLVAQTGFRVHLRWFPFDEPPIGDDIDTRECIAKDGPEGKVNKHVHILLAK